MNALECSNISLKVENSLLLRDVSFLLEAGKIHVVLGANGAGKSTLLKVIAGELKASRGELLYAGKALRKWPGEKLANSLAVLPQQSQLNFPFSVHEVVALARTPHSTGKTCDEQIISAAIQAMDIAHLQTRLYTQLSGGEKQRCQIARVLAQIWRQQDAGDKPRLLLMDEPTAFLDLGHQQQLMQQLRKLAVEGVTVVMVLHDINLAVSVADYVLAFKSGQLLCKGHPESILSTGLINELFAARTTLVNTEQGAHYVLAR